MTAVVTGASGFAGGVLVRELLKLGRPVRAIVRSNPSSLKGLDIEVVRADILDPTALRSAFKSATSIFHFAAGISLGNSDRGRLLETNVTGSLNPAEVALDVGVQLYIHCSSIHACDLTDPHAFITETTHRVGSEYPIYDQSKAMCESVVRKVIRAGLPGVTINPSSVIGPYDHRPSRIGKVLIDLAARKFPALVPGGFE